MGKLADQIRDTQVEPGSVAIFWISQAGFVFKSPAGKVVYIDPYLTDYVHRILPNEGYGYKRIMMTPIEPHEVEADYVLCTHSHADHFDLDAITELAKKPGIYFYGAPDCEELYRQAGVPEDRFTIFHEGESFDLGDFRLTGVHADHGELAPDALGILLEVAGTRIWQVGDTAYCADAWQPLFDQGVDVLIPPINGAFGNLNGKEAARMAHAAHARVVIPCHFWMFVEHFGSPAEFMEACKSEAPDARPLLMSQGERFIYPQ